ncbi:amino acid adenylation domain-containing protein, partial [Aquimarina sp. RZ0]|uniref:non-ribosomal peptide synthetase n=1 Tax=Aquimarina sp. RZ0 TaxID=2607730 RepID=UPI0011F27BC0
EQLLSGFNATAVAYPLEKTVVDLFTSQVALTPEATALVFEGVSLSYQELDRQSNRLAHYLVSQGIGADDLVGICLDRSIEMVVGILGILKSGGAYVPIKPDSPVSRISHMVADGAIGIVLSDVSSVGVLEDLPIRTVVLDEDSAEYLSSPDHALDLVYSPDSLSYVIYTSGSTGVPKGAMIEHKGLLNHLLLMIDELGMDSNSVVAFTAPFTFDISVWQLLSGLLSGGRIVIYSEASILDVSGFQSRASKDGITLLQLVPSYVSNLLDNEEDEGLDQLRYFLVTGEAVSTSLLSRWFSRYPDVPVVNAYGPAEASDDVTLHIMDKAPSTSLVPIGKPVANMQLYVLDSLDQLCPIGVVGELCVSGVGVGRGYLNDEDKTASSFVSHPFIAGTRMYKTGDLGRWLSDGTLEFMGRSDDQVKIRGYRIELGEIENVLLSHELVSSCCVVSRLDDYGTHRLVGYVVVDGDFDKVVIQEYLGSSLPDYMIPHQWVDLDDMPLTANGKIDKKRLPAPDVSFIGEEYVEASSAVELSLAGIWQELLGVDRIGIYANFFDLGGHSLLATRLVSMIRKELSIEVSIRDVFEHTTIEALGRHI